MPRSSFLARRRRVVVSLLIVLVLIGAGWVVGQAARGAADLRVAADRLRDAQAALRAGDPWTATLGSAAERAAAGRRHLDDPLVRAVSRLPVLGRPLDTARGLATATDAAVSSALVPLGAALGDRPARRLIPAAGTVDLAALRALEAPSGRAAAALRTAQSSALGTQATGIAQLDDARAELTQRLAELLAAVDGQHAAARVAPSALGAGGTRRYLVLSQSPSEPRGTGGLLGGFTVVEASEGRLSVSGSGSRRDLVSPDVPVLDLGPEFEEHYGPNFATYGWINANTGPDVPDFGRIAAELWRRQTGQQLDGVVLVDPVALSYLLRATGPVELADGTRVRPDTVADLLLRDVYQRYSGTTREDDVVRDDYLQAVSLGVTRALLSRDVQPRALAQALGDAVADRRVRVWSALPDVQAELAQHPLGGALPEGRAVGDVVVDAVGSKLGYYLARVLRYEPGCSGARSRLQLELRNTAPAAGLPAYVTPERYRAGLPPGTFRSLTTLYLPAGSIVNDVTVEGVRPAQRNGTEKGLVWVEVVVELLPGQAKTVAVDFTEPDPSLPVQRVQQSLVRPEVFTVSDCS